MYKLPKGLKKREKNLGSLVSIKEIWYVIKNLPTKKTPGPDDFSGEL